MGYERKCSRVLWRISSRKITQIISSNCVSNMEFFKIGFYIFIKGDTPFCMWYSIKRFISFSHNYKTQCINKALPINQYNIPHTWEHKSHEALGTITVSIYRNTTAIYNISTKPVTPNTQHYIPQSYANTKIPRLYRTNDQCGSSTEY